MGRRQGLFMYFFSRRLQSGDRSTTPEEPRVFTERLHHIATTRTSAPIERIDHSYLVEEETVSGYQPKHYYPVRLGELFNDRYETIGKLGFGSASTV